MNEKFSYTKKGILFGILVTFILLLIPSYSAPNQNYSLQKTQYEGYVSVTTNCGENPSDSCLRSLCAGKSLIGFCEGVNKYDPESSVTWKTYTRSEKPDVIPYLLPDFSNGFEMFAMFGILGLIALIAPIIVGLVIGKIMDRRNLIVQQ